MSNLIRKQFYITKAHDALLKSKAKQMGISEAELVRRALETQASTIDLKEETANLWQEEQAFFQQLMDNEYEQKKRTWKREDLYEI